MMDVIHLLHNVDCLRFESFFIYDIICFCTQFLIVLIKLSGIYSIHHCFYVLMKIELYEYFKHKIRWMLYVHCAHCLAWQCSGDTCAIERNTKYALISSNDTFFLIIQMFERSIQESIHSFKNVTTTVTFWVFN